MQRLIKIASLFVFAPLVAGCAGGGSMVPATSSVSPVSAQATVPYAPPAEELSAHSRRSANEIALSDAVAINAGGPATGSYSADGNFSSASSWESVVKNAINTSAVTDPGPAAVYQSNRVSPAILYTIGGLTANKAYVVRLSFVESYWQAAGKRVFNVAVNGTPFLTNFDIFAKAGGANKAITETTPSETSNSLGQFTVRLTAVKDNAEIAAIEIQNIAPAGGASPSPSPAPTASATSNAPAMDASLICVHFAKNPMCDPLPASPAVSASSAQWAALLFQSGHASFGGPVQSNVANPDTDTSDTSEPGESVSPGIKTVSQRIVCNKVSYGPSECEAAGLQDTYVNVPANMEPEGNQDHHFTFDSTTASGEYDFWLSNDLGAAGSDLNVGTAGFCKWGGDGTGCSNATATGIATSIGGLDPALVKAGESSPSGTLGYALSATALCADPSYVYPAKSSDGNNTSTTPACLGHTAAGGRPPEGTRWFLNVTDAQVNALAVPAYDKVILRTMDRQHFGGVIVDTNWSGAPGLSIDFHRGNYTFMATEAGLPYSNDQNIPISTSGLNLANSVEFCTNGTC